MRLFLWVRVNQEEMTYVLQFANSWEHGFLWGSISPKRSRIRILEALYLRLKRGKRCEIVFFFGNFSQIANPSDSLGQGEAPGLTRGTIERTHKEDSASAEGETDWRNDKIECCASDQILAFHCQSQGNSNHLLVKYSVKQEVSGQGMWEVRLDVSLFTWNLLLIMHGPNVSKMRPDRWDGF